MSKSLSAKQRGVVVTQPFCARGSYALTTGQAKIFISPSVFPRVAAQADLYELYRFTQLRFRISTFAGFSSGVADELIIAAYFSGSIDSNPALADLNENIVSCLFPPNQTVKSEWVDVPKVMLKGPLPWYKAVAGTMETWDELQGVICIASANAGSSGSAIIELEGVVEFTSPADPGATPMERARRRDLKERERLLKLLASAPGDNQNLPGKTAGKTGKSL